jgi:hypothetical protein
LNKAARQRKVAERKSSSTPQTKRFNTIKGGKSNGPSCVEY